VLGNYAIVLERLGRQDDALAMYERAIDADPNHANNLGNYASLLVNAERLDEAIVTYERAVAAAPDDPAALNSAALIATRLGRDDDAMTLYERAIDIDPNHANTLGNYAGLLAGRDEVGELETLARRALEFASKGEEPLELEVHFYLWARGAEAQRATHREAVDSLLDAGVRSPGWDLEKVVLAAERAGHPESAALRSAAERIASSS
jgi:tetratricopeptide (TPR) repeat protein